MSFYTKIVEGCITLKADAEPKEIERLLEEQDINFEYTGHLEYDLYSSFIKYRDDAYKELAKHCRNDSYLRFIGEDYSIWSLILNDGTVTEKEGTILWDLAKEIPNKASIPLGDGFSIVAEPNMDSDYKEMFVFLRDDSTGNAYQDLAIISENYRYIADENSGEDIPSPIHGSYSVKVYSDPDNENWQQDYNFGRHEE